MKLLKNNNPCSNITIHFYKNKKHILVENYKSSFVPRVGDTLDLEFIRQRHNHIFKEQYAKIKKVTFFYSKPNKKGYSSNHIIITAKIIKE